MKVYLVGVEKFTTNEIRDTEELNYKKESHIVTEFKKGRKIKKNDALFFGIEANVINGEESYFLGYISNEAAQVAADSASKNPDEHFSVIELEIDDKNQVLMENEKSGLYKIPILPGTKIISAFFKNPTFEVKFSELPESPRKTLDSYLELAISSNLRLKGIKTSLSPSQETISALKTLTAAAELSQSKSQPVEITHVNNEAAKASENVETHNHVPASWNGAAKAFVGMISVGVALSLFHFSLPIICLASILSGIAIKQSLNLIDLMACKKAKSIEDVNYIPVNAAHAFNAGIEAAQSYKGYFSAWLKITSYTNYPSYSAGKHLAENGKNNKFKLN